jgi:PKD repeat protein
MEVYNQQVAMDPSRAVRLAEIEQQVQSWIAKNGNRRGGNVITIPIVFHVVHNGQAIGTGPNISDAQVLSQIDVLNEDFRRLNADSINTPAPFQAVASDCEIEFCLATLDPSGQPTSGIHRYNGGQSAWDISSADGTLKPATIWDRDDYLNIWTVNLGGGLLGYAQFPGGSANTDGVVIGYQYCGRYPDNPNVNDYNLGRTATHEVGHWLNLYHIWGDDGTACTGSDLVGDTPNQADEHFGCPTFPAVSCSNGPNGDMFMNYMDYTDDDCMNIFTTGQKNRMRAALNTTRLSIQSSPACTPLEFFAFTGTVADASTLAGLNKAQVLFKGTLFDIPAQTDANGNFNIGTFYEDTYDIYAAIWGHQSKLLTSVFIDSLTGPLTIPLDSGYYDDFILDLGWTTSNTATTGLWVRDAPIGTTNGGTPVNPGSDVPGDFGTECYVTGNAGGGAGTDDVDGGTVTLSSPAMDLTGYVDPYLSFYRWFQNDGGTGTPNDNLRISIDNGVVSDTLDYVDVNGTLGQWVFRDLRVLDYVPLSNNMTVTLLTGDLGGGHLVEAALDLFAVRDSIVGTQMPQAAFTLSSTVVCEGSSITFTDQSTNGPNALQWLFPGGSPSSSVSAAPTIAYNTAGIYGVTLIVTNAGGADTLTQLQLITVNDNPNVSIAGTNVLCNGDSSGAATAVVTGGTPPFAYAWTTLDTTATISGLFAGFYNLTVTDTNGCMDVTTVSITQPPVINATTSSTPEHDTAADGTATVNPSGGVQPYSYQWSDAQTTQTATGLATGVYTVTVTDANGCMKVVQVTVDRITGLHVNRAEGWQVYPNPTSGIVTVRLYPSGTVEIRNALGQSVTPSQDISGMQTIDLSSHPAGIYLITLMQPHDTHSITLELVK